MAGSQMRHKGLRLAEVRPTSPAPDFAPILARGLAGLEPHHASVESLTLRLSLSNWMRRSGASFDATVRELLGLRGALLRSSGLDSESEPVPLAARGDARTVLNLAVYVLGLIDRSARCTGIGRNEVVEVALASG